MQETFRISIPITVEDNTDPGVSQATRKINGFDRANQKTQERLNQMNRTKYQVVLDTLDRASGVIGKVSSKARSIAGKTFSFTMKVVDMATAPLRGIWNFATSIQGAILGATGAFAGIYKPMDIAGDYEQTQIAFETMLKSAEKAEQFLKDASEFANKTPFEFPELINSSKLLLAFGFEADKILDLMTVIGDTSSGLGAGAEGIDRITRALGQMQAKGRAQAEELLQLQELGVPANQILQEELGLTGEQIGNIGKESIEAAKVIDALLRGMDKRFGGMMANQSKTAKGMMSTLKDTLQNSLLRPWGQGLWEGVKPGLEKITTWIDENQETIAAWGEAWKKAGANISKWVMTKVEDLQGRIRRMTNSQEWKDAQTFGAKMKIVWDQVIAQPFNEWWNSTGKAWLADKASKIGNGIGSAITYGILALLGVDVKGAAADGTSIGASFAEGFKVGFDGRKVGEGILNAIKGVFKDAGTLFPGGKEASSTSWISAGLLTIMGIKGAKGIGTIFKGGKGIYNYGKRLFKGSNAADAAIHATKAVGAATGSLDKADDIAKATAHLKDAAGSFRTAANASKEAEKAVKTAEVLKAAKQADLEKSARLLKELKKEAAKFGDDIPKGLSGKIKAADKTVTKGRVDVKKAASHLDDMVNLKNLKAIDYANAREGFVVAKDVANAAKVADKAGDVAGKTGIFSKIAGWFGKSGDDVLKAGSKAAGKGIKGIPVLGTLLGLAASGAVVASAAPENRGREAAGEVGSWLGAIGTGAGAGALVGTLGGGPIGTAAGAIAGGIGGAIGGEAFAEWLYDQKNAIGGFFSNTLPSVAGSAWDALKMGASDAGTWISNKWSGFSDWFGTSVWKPVKDVGISAINIATGAWSGARDAISDKWSDFSNWFDENAWEPVSNTAQAAGQQVSDKWGEARTWVGEHWIDFAGWFEASIWGPVKTGAQAAGTWVGERWSEAKTWVSETWGTVSGWFSDTVWEPVKGAAQTAGAWLGDQFTAAKNAISEAWAGVSGWFDETVWGPLTRAAQTAGTWVGDKFMAAKSAVSEAWSGVAGWFETNVWGPIKSGATRAWNQASNKLNNLAQKGSKDTGLTTSKGKVSVLEHAWGGIMTKPHMGIVAEAGPEAIIPLSPSKRSGALSLWQQTGQMLGVTPHADGGIFGKLKSVGNVVKEFAGDKISAIGTTAKKAWGSIKTVFSTDKASAAGNTTESIAIGLESTRRGQENTVKSIYKPYQKKIASITSPDFGEYEKVREIAHMAKNLNRRFGKATKIASRVAIPLSLIASVTEIIGLEDKKRAIVKELGSVLGAVGVSALVGAGTGALVGAGVLSPVTALLGSIIGAGAGAFGGQAVANKLYDRFAFHADGGIMTKPHMGIVAEAGAEGIIPLSPSKRSRGIDLWQRTGEILGVRPYEDGGIVGDEQEQRPKGVPTGRGGQNITIKVEVKAEPRFTIEGSGDTTDENKVLAVLKAYIREMTDDIGDELAERLARIFANMPAKGGAEA